MEGPHLSESNCFQGRGTDNLRRKGLDHHWSVTTSLLEAQKRKRAPQTGNGWALGGVRESNREKAMNFT